MKRLALTTLTVLLLLSPAGCTSSEKSSDRRDPARITQAEVAAFGTAGSAYSLVERLRPLWLRRRGRHSFVDESSIWVYVDGTRVGPPEALDQIDVMNVASMAFFGAAEATRRYGAGHDHGAIFVRMKNR